MSPGILQDTSLLEQLQQNNDTVLRAKWDARELDGKMHMPLGKRNSTPVGASHSSTTSTTHAQFQVQAKVQLATTMESPNNHRRLDRSHSEPVVKGGEGRQANSSRYKTELCRPYEENGACKYGDKCQFAHGHGELRSLARHPKYKTELCRTFHTIGFCPYGPRCHFIHNAEERRDSGPSGQLYPPLTGKQQMLYMNNSLAMGCPAESPPASHHGSPTSSAESFFDEKTFSLFPSSGSSCHLDSLSSYGLPSSGLISPSGSSCNGQTMCSPNGSSCNSLCSPGGNSCNIQTLQELNVTRESTLLPIGVPHTMETPPTSPVESLAGDVDNLSLSSSSHSSSPTPVANAFDNGNPLRLPIFAQLSREQDVVGLGAQPNVVVG